ncbi:MAG: hypothetical protein SV775_18390, partial [Thermodesulfobacteriota bacterium]|nr:hypothetical protein [Thermodesulfobacteriota bacterium]
HIHGPDVPAIRHVRADRQAGREDLIPRYRVNSQTVREDKRDPHVPPDRRIYPDFLRSYDVGQEA